MIVQQCFLLLKSSQKTISNFYLDSLIVTEQYKRWNINNGTTIDDVENLDLIMPMYNLIEYSTDYSETTGSLWLYSKDEATNFDADIANNNNFKSFEYKVKLLETAVADGPNGILRNTTITVQLKYLSNFWRSLERP